MHITILLLLYIPRLVFSNKMEPFIVGGKPATLKHFGHSAFMIIASSKGSIVCGASIVNQNLVLSAAHCFEDFDKKCKVTVRAGDVDRNKGSVRYGARLAVHKDYDPLSIVNDIALVYLKHPFVFNDYIKRVIIMKQPPRTDTGYVAGWGRVDEERKIDSDHLKLAQQKLWSRRDCERMLKRMPPGIICGGVKYSREYAAEGDSGCALVIDGPIQVGLVSFKRPEISNSIAVYTDVAHFYNWIQSTAEKLICN